MQVAIFGKDFKPDFEPYFQNLINILLKHHVQIIVFAPYYNYVQHISGITPADGIKVFSSSAEMLQNTDYCISIGGDGTLLEAATYVKDSGIPLIGINSGRLGFLADIARDEIENSMNDLFQGNFSIEQRVLLSLRADKEYFGELNFALNELTLHKKDSASMITIHTYVNGDYLNSYWADGLIIATPTGSTAYSLSVGGPIVSPTAGNFIISPIAPHNLTVRPMVLPDDCEIKLVVEGRNHEYLASLDSRSAFISDYTELYISKANFRLHLVKFSNNTFFKTLRNKLMWGADKRN